MFVRDYLPFIIFIGLAYATLCLLVEIFLGHYGVPGKILLVVLISCIPFIGDLVTLIFVLQVRLNRAAGRLRGRLCLSAWL